MLPAGRGVQNGGLLGACLPFVSAGAAGSFKNTHQQALHSKYPLRSVNMIRSRCCWPSSARTFKLCLKCLLSRLADGPIPSQAEFIKRSCTNAKVGALVLGPGLPRPAYKIWSKASSQLQALGMGGWISPTATGAGSLMRHDRAILRPCHDGWCTDAAAANQQHKQQPGRPCTHACACMCVHAVQVYHETFNRVQKTLDLERCLSAQELSAAFG